MYEVIWLQAAEQDLAAAARYIAGVLANRSAAIRLIERATAAADSLREMPLRFPVYAAGVPLRQVYRVLPIGHYQMYYYVSDRRVVIARLLYAGRNTAADDFE